MKDQGKISELNPDTASRCVSSHCYQTSSSVGRMAETYVPQGFLGFHIKRGSNIPVERASEKSLTESPRGLQRTRSRNLRRRKSRALMKERILAALPPDASYQEQMRILYPVQTRQKEDAAHRKQARSLKHSAYLEFLQQFNHEHHNLELKPSRFLYYEVFSPDYDTQLPAPYSMSPQAVSMALSHLEPRPTIHRSELPDPNFYSSILEREKQKPSLLPSRPANPSEYTTGTQSIPRSTTIAQDRYTTHSTPIVRERYSTQIGGLTFYGPKSGSVAALSRTGAATSKTNQANYTPQAGKVPVDISTLSLRLLDSERFVTFPDNIQEGLHLLYHLCSFRNYCHSGLAIVLFYVLLRVVIDLCLTIRFVVGLLLGFFIPKPSYASAYPPQRARPFYVPQSGEAETLELAPESSDFQGVKPDASAVAESAAPVPLATNKDHSSCLASTSTSSSLPASGHLVNASAGFALGLRSPAKPTTPSRQQAPPAVSRQAGLPRHRLGFGV